MDSGELMELSSYIQLEYSSIKPQCLVFIHSISCVIFQDLFFVALDKGEKELAAVAKKKADEIEQEFPPTSETGENSNIYIYIYIQSV